MSDPAAESSERAGPASCGEGGSGHGDTRGPVAGGAVTRRAGRRVGGTRGSLWPALFLFPALFVTIFVLVYLFFVASAQDSRDVSEIIRDLRAGGGHSREQDAFALAQKVVELSELGGPPRYFTAEQTKELLELLDEAAADDKLREYLVMAVGRAGQPAQTLPVLERLLSDPATSSSIRASALAALSLSRSPEAVEPVLAQLRTSTAAEDWEVRLLALHALVNISTDGGAEVVGEGRQRPLVRLVVAELQRHVHDDRREVRWNVSSWLARYYGDGSGRAALERLLDWEFLDAERGDRDRALRLEEKEKWMQLALEGLFRLDGEALRSTLEEKRSDRSLKVRDTALSILGRLDSGASARGADSDVGPARDGDRVARGVE